MFECSSAFVSLTSENRGYKLKDLSTQQNEVCWLLHKQASTANAIGFAICHPGKDPGDHGCSLAMAYARRQSFIFMVLFMACRSKYIVSTKRFCVVILK